MNSTVEKLWNDVGRCKAAETCSRLGVRTYFFEPNPGTIASWQAEGRFKPSVDRRVVFVCESPTKHAAGAPDFKVPAAGISGWRCWGGYNAAVTDDFWKVRARYGFQHCWITNVVKCGAGPGRGRPDASEVAQCAVFVKRELEMIQPAVIALVGTTHTPRMFKAAMKAAPPALQSQPMVTAITHYSYARKPQGRGRMLEIWRPEFDAITAELERRNLAEPLWL